MEMIMVYPVYSQTRTRYIEYPIYLNEYLCNKYIQLYILKL